MDLEHVIHIIDSDCDAEMGVCAPECLPGYSYYRRVFVLPKGVQGQEELANQMLDFIRRDMHTHFNLLGQCVLFWRKKPFWSGVGGAVDDVLDCSYRILPVDLADRAREHAKTFKPSFVRAREQFEKDVALLKEHGIVEVETTDDDITVAGNRYTPRPSEEEA